MTVRSQSLLSDLRIQCPTSEFSVRPQNLVSDLRIYCPTSEFTVRPQSFTVWPGFFEVQILVRPDPAEVYYNVEGPFQRYLPRGFWDPSSTLKSGVTSFDQHLQKLFSEYRVFVRHMGRGGGPPPSPGARSWSTSSSKIKHQWSSFYASINSPGDRIQYHISFFSEYCFLILSS